jgi:hypothetical protein
MAQTARKSPYHGPYKEGVKGDARWRTRTIEGIALTKLRDKGLHEWEGVIDGERWRFTQLGDRKWQGFTADHVTGTARSYSLKRTVAWVIEHREEWQAKVRVRRKAGTRMVDPAA